ncbi:MAG: glycosyltransferase family 39 protein [Candidatus Omnitrophota bacterium]
MKQIITGHLLDKNKLLCIFIIFIAVILRLYHLGNQSLWLDEAYSVMMSKNVVMLWAEQIKDPMPPLYYSMLHYWILIWGGSEFSLRLLSALFGILLIPLVFITGATIFDRKTGIYAALFAAISPIHIYYSQEARAYTLLAFLSLASSFMLYLSIEKNRNIFWIAYILATVLCLYAHNYGILLLSAQICFCLFFPVRNILQKFAWSQLCILLAYLPRIAILFRQIRLDMNPWISAPTIKDLFSTFLRFSLLSWRLPITPLLSVILKITVPILVLIFIIGLVNRERQNLFLSTYLIIPLALAFFISLKIPSYVAGRYDILVFPAFCLIMGVGLNNVRIPFLRLVLVIIITVATSCILFNYYFIYRKSNDRVISEYVQKNSDKRDVIVATGLSVVPFEYYWRQNFPPRLFKFPDGPRSAIVRDALMGDEKYINFEIKKLTEKIYPLLNENNRLWILYQPYIFSDRLLYTLKKDFKNTDIITYPKGDNLNQVSRLYIFKRR